MSLLKDLVKYERRFDPKLVSYNNHYMKKGNVI